MMKMTTHLVVCLAALATLASCAGKKEILVGEGPLHDACSGGDLQKCHAQAVLLEAGDAAERRDALTAFQFGCLLKHAPSCTGLARMYGQESGGGVMETLREACDGGEPEACVRVGDRSVRELAVGYYERACEADHGNGCHKLAMSMRKGWVIEENMSRAAELDERACELGSTEGCLSAGQAYMFGSGVDVDEAKGAQLLDKSCNQKTRAGCRTLAVMYEKGIGVPVNAEKASQYYELAGPESEIVADSPAKAYIVFVDACNRGNFIGCFDAAWFLEEGVDVERNITTSREMFEKSCKGGVQPACERVKRGEGESG